MGHTREQEYKEWYKEEVLKELAEWEKAINEANGELDVKLEKPPEAEENYNPGDPPPPKRYRAAKRPSNPWRSTSTPDETDIQEFSEVAEGSNRDAEPPKRAMWEKPKCECGADSVGSDRHSTWCPMYRKYD